MLSGLLSYLSVQRLYRYLLKRALGSLLRTPVEQLEVQLMEGELRLFDLEINPAVINKTLGGFGLGISQAHVARIRVAIPWTKLFSGKCRIYLEGLRVEMVAGWLGNLETGTDQIAEKESSQSSAVKTLTGLVEQILLHVEFLAKDVKVILPGHAELAISEVLVLSPEPFLKKISVSGSLVRIDEHDLLRTQPLVLSVDLKKHSIVGGSDGVKMQLNKDGISGLSKLFKVFQADQLDNMFHSVLEEAAKSNLRPWYEEKDIYELFTSTSSNVQIRRLSEDQPEADFNKEEKLLQEQLSETALNSNRWDIKVRIERTEMDLLSDDKQLKGRYLKISAMGVCYDHSEFRCEGLAMNLIQPVIVASAHEDADKIWMSATEDKDDELSVTSYSSVVSSGRPTPPSSFDGGSSLGDPEPEDDGLSESAEGRFFQGTYTGEYHTDLFSDYDGQLILSVESHESDSAGIFENDLLKIGTIQINLEASQLAFIFALISSISGASEYTLKRSISNNDLKDIIQISLPFKVSAKVEIKLSHEQGSCPLQIIVPAINYRPGGKWEASSFQISGQPDDRWVWGQNVEFQIGKRDASALQLAPKEVVDNDSWMQDWTELVKGTRSSKRTNEPQQVSEPSNDLFSSRVHEPAVLEIEIQIENVSITSNGVNFAKLQIALAAFADRLSAASSTFQGYPQMGPMIPGNVPPKLGLNIKVSKFSLGGFISGEELSVRLVSIMCNTEQVTQMGALISRLVIQNEDVILMQSFKSQCDQTCDNTMFSEIWDKSVTSGHNLKLFVYQIPRQNETHMTTFYNIQLAGLHLLVDPVNLSEIIKLKFIPFFFPTEAPLLPAPTPLSPKSFTILSLNVVSAVAEIPSIKDRTLLAAFYIKGLSSETGSSMQFENGPSLLATGLGFQLSGLEIFAGNNQDGFLSALRSVQIDRAFIESGLVSIGNVENLKGKVKLGGSQFDLDLSANHVSLEFCSDSLHRLQSIIDELTELFKIAVNYETSIKSMEAGIIPAADPVEDHLLREPEQLGPYLPRGLPRKLRSEDFLVTENFVKSFAPSLGKVASSSQPLGTARWFVDPTTVAVLQDHLLGSFAAGSVPVKRLIQIPPHWGLESALVDGSLNFHVNRAVFTIYDGEDWPALSLGCPQSKGARRKKNSVALEFRGLELLAERGKAAVAARANAKDDKGSFAVKRFKLTAQEWDCKDMVGSSVYQYLFSKKEAPISQAARFSISILSVQGGETAAEIDLGPLCITVDQDTVEFLGAFISRYSALCYKSIQAGSLDTPTEQVVDQATGTSLQISMLRISAIELELNYRAKRLSVAGLRRGEPLEFLNLLPMLEGLGLRLGEVNITEGGLSLDEIGRRISQTWGRDINKAQIVRSLSGLTPIRSFTNLLTVGLADLVEKPVRQFRRKDGSVSTGLVRGISSFFGTLVVESLALTDLCVSGAQGVLTAVEGQFASPTDSAEPVELLWDETGEDWTEVERGQRPYLPASASEGLQVGTHALIRGIFGGLQLGLGHSNDSVPQTVISAAKRLPLFVLRPALGATQAMSVAVKSAREAVDGTRQRELQRRYKAPFTRG